MSDKIEVANCNHTRPLGDSGKCPDCGYYVRSERLEAATNVAMAINREERTDVATRRWAAWDTEKVIQAWLDAGDLLFTIDTTLDITVREAARQGYLKSVVSP